MNDQMGPGSLLDTTDSLEAVGVFRGWKNFMFLIVLLCLLILQGSFWLVNTETVALTEPPKDDTAVAAAPETTDPNAAPAAAAVEPNTPVENAKKSTLQAILPDITFKCLTQIIDLTNAVLILSSGLYMLTVLFSLKVSLMGKIGGVNHISRAFFLAMIMFVLILPWQKVFDGMAMGAIYTPAELAEAFPKDRTEIFDMVLYYLRFSGYWLLIFLLLILTQMRTCRWTRAILRRLEVI